MASARFIVLSFASNGKTLWPINGVEGARDSQCSRDSSWRYYLRQMGDIPNFNLLWNKLLAHEGYRAHSFGELIVSEQGSNIIARGSQIDGDLRGGHRDGGMLSRRSSRCYDYISEVIEIV